MPQSRAKVESSTAALQHLIQAVLNKETEKILQEIALNAMFESKGSGVQLTDNSTRRGREVETSRSFPMPTMHKQKTDDPTEYHLIMCSGTVRSWGRHEVSCALLKMAAEIPDFQKGKMKIHT